MLLHTDDMSNEECSTDAEPTMTSGCNHGVDVEGVDDDVIGDGVDSNDVFRYEPIQWWWPMRLEYSIGDGTS